MDSKQFKMLNECPDLLYHVSIQVDRHIVKKNRRPIYVNKKTGRPFTGKSDELKRAEENLVLHMRQAGEHFGLRQPIDFEVWCVFHFYYPANKYYTKDGRLNRKNVADLDNLITLPQDCLQGAGILKDDSLISSLDLSRRFPSDSTTLEVFILNPADDTM